MGNYEIIEAGQGRYIKAWNHGVFFEQEAIQQLINAARLSIVHPYIAAMADTHKGYGSTVGSVIPTKDAVIPAAVGVDIGCGMIYRRLDICREDLPEHLGDLRASLEQEIPNGGPGTVGAWDETVPTMVCSVWMRNFSEEYDALTKKHPEAISSLAMRQLGTLGTGNHFVELTVESKDNKVGILIHSGSRGLGNKIGSYFTRVARQYCEQRDIALPDRDLAFLPRGTEEFDDYIKALRFAQRYAWENRLLMMYRAFSLLQGFAARPLVNNNPPFEVHCHHNYLAEETHFGEKLFITRKGAVRAAEGDMGIIPGSMGAKSYIVRGLGSTDSFTSCSHGAGRMMSRTQAKKFFTVDAHILATLGVECDKTKDTLDETPGAYKAIDDVIAAQTDLIEPLFHMKQILCVKGKGEDRKWGKKVKANA
jgi:tRNA-splicing ligase RtcB